MIFGLYARKIFEFRIFRAKGVFLICIGFVAVFIAVRRHIAFILDEKPDIVEWGDDDD